MKIREAGPADAPDIGRVHVETWRSAYREVGPADYLEAVTYEDWGSHRGPGTPPAYRCTFVAESPSGEILGYASGGSDRSQDGEFDAELYSVYVSEPHQRKGIGRRLALSLATRLAEQGLGSMRGWLLADNPARGFCESLEGRCLVTRPVTLGRSTVEEVSYGWPDLGDLIARYGES